MRRSDQYQAAMTATTTMQTPKITLGQMFSKPQKTTSRRKSLSSVMDTFDVHFESPQKKSPLSSPLQLRSKDEQSSKPRRRSSITSIINSFEQPTTNTSSSRPLSSALRSKDEPSKPRRRSSIASIINSFEPTNTTPSRPLDLQPKPRRRSSISSIMDALEATNKYPTVKFPLPQPREGSDSVITSSTSGSVVTEVIISNVEMADGGNGVLYFTPSYREAKVGETANATLLKAKSEHVSFKATKTVGETATATLLKAKSEHGSFKATMTARKTMSVSDHVFSHFSKARPTNNSISARASSWFFDVMNSSESGPRLSVASMSEGSEKLLDFNPLENQGLAHSSGVTTNPTDSLWNEELQWNSTSLQPPASEIDSSAHKRSSSALRRINKSPQPLAASDLDTASAHVSSSRRRISKSPQPPAVSAMDSSAHVSSSRRRISKSPQPPAVSAMDSSAHATSSSRHRSSKSPQPLAASELDTSSAHASSSRHKMSKSPQPIAASEMDSSAHNASSSSRRRISKSPQPPASDMDSSAHPSASLLRKSKSSRAVVASEMNSSAHKEPSATSSRLRKVKSSGAVVATEMDSSAYKEPSASSSRRKTSISPRPPPSSQRRNCRSPRPQPQADAGSFDSSWNSSWHSTADNNSSQHFNSTIPSPSEHGKSKQETKESWHSSCQQFDTVSPLPIRSKETKASELFCAQMGESCFDITRTIALNKASGSGTSLLSTPKHADTDDNPPTIATSPKVHAIARKTTMASRTESSSTRRMKSHTPPRSSGAASKEVEETETSRRGSSRNSSRNRTKAEEQDSTALEIEPENVASSKPKRRGRSSHRGGLKKSGSKTALNAKDGNASDVFAHSILNFHDSILATDLFQACAERDECLLREKKARKGVERRQRCSKPSLKSAIEQANSTVSRRSRSLESKDTSVSGGKELIHDTGFASNLESRRSMSLESKGRKTAEQDGKNFTETYRTADVDKDSIFKADFLDSEARGGGTADLFQANFKNVESGEAASSNPQSRSPIMSREGGGAIDCSADPLSKSSHSSRRRTRSVERPRQTSYNNNNDPQVNQRPVERRPSRPGLSRDTPGSSRRLLIRRGETPPRARNVTVLDKRLERHRETFHSTPPVLGA